MGDWKAQLAALKQNVFSIEEKVTEERVKRGSVIKVPLDDSDGLILEPGKKDRDKYIVVIGFTATGDVIGALLINTNPAEYTEELRNCQYHVKKTRYPAILDYDSWLNCGSIFDISIDKLKKKGLYKGDFLDEDLEYVLGFLRETDIYTPKEKRKYGLIE